MALPSSGVYISFRLFVCCFLCDCRLQWSVFKVKINIISLRALIITVIALHLLLTIPMGSHSSIKKDKPFKSLNHLILCILLVFHLRVMGCEICTMMRKQLTSTPVVYVYCTDEGPAEAIILIHRMVSTRGLSEVTWWHWIILSFVLHGLYFAPVLEWFLPLTSKIMFLSHNNN